MVLPPMQPGEEQTPLRGYSNVAKHASVVAGDTCASSHTALLRLDEVLTPRSLQVQQSHLTSAGALHDSQEVISSRLDLSHSPQVVNSK